MLGLVSWPLRGKHIQNLHRHEHPWTIQANSTSGPPCHWFGSDPASRWLALWMLAMILFLSSTCCTTSLGVDVDALPSKWGEINACKSYWSQRHAKKKKKKKNYLRLCSTDPHPPTWCTLIACAENSSQAWTLLLVAQIVVDSVERESSVGVFLFRLRLLISHSQTHTGVCSPRLILPLYTHSSCTWHVLRTEPVATVSVDSYRQLLAKGGPYNHDGVPKIMWIWGCQDAHIYGVCKFLGFTKFTRSDAHYVMAMTYSK